MIDILTGTAFDAPKRLNHREDEVALEFPSSATSRRYLLNALRAQNWIASTGGDDMQTITCENDQWGITNVIAWMDEMRAAGKIPENYALFAKDFAYKQYDHAAHYNSVICAFNGWNGNNKCVVTSNGPSIHVTQVGNSGLSVCGIKGGQVFYVMDRAAAPAS